jgi:hypothetical protein
MPTSLFSLLLGFLLLMPAITRPDDTDVAVSSIEAAGAVTETAPADATVRHDPYLLSPGRVGRLELGAGAAALSAAWGDDRLRRVERDEDGTLMPAIEVYATPQHTGRPQLIFGLEEGDVLSGAEIYSPDYHTPQGITVKSTMKDLRFAFKNLNPKQVVLDDDGTLSVTLDDLRMTFVLDSGAMSETALDRYEIKRDPKMIPDSVPITRIVLF